MREGDRNKGKLTVPKAYQSSSNICASEHFFNHFFIVLFVLVVHHDERILPTLPPDIYGYLCGAV